MNHTSNILRRNRHEKSISNPVELSTRTQESDMKKYTTFFFDFSILNENYNWNRRINMLLYVVDKLHSVRLPKGTIYGVVARAKSMINPTH